jgi:hypothetical protein
MLVPVDLRYEKDFPERDIFLRAQASQAVALKGRFRVGNEKPAVVGVVAEGIPFPMLSFHGVSVGIFEVLVELMVKAPEGGLESVELELTLMGDVDGTGTFDIDPSVRVEIRWNRLRGEGGKQENCS